MQMYGPITLTTLDLKLQPTTNDQLYMVYLYQYRDFLTYVETRELFP